MNVFERSTDLDEITTARRKFQAQAIGPRGSALLALPGERLVVLKCEWTQGMKRVRYLAENSDDIDSATEWVSFKESHVLSCGLEIEWVQPNYTARLYFEPGKWATELEIMSQSGSVILAPEDAKGTEMFDKGMFVQCESDLLTAIARLANEPGA